MDAWNKKQHACIWCIVLGAQNDIHYIFLETYFQQFRPIAKRLEARRGMHQHSSRRDYPLILPVYSLVGAYHPELPDTYCIILLEVNISFFD